MEQVCDVVMDEQFVGCVVCDGFCWYVVVGVVDLQDVWVLVVCECVEEVGCVFVCFVGLGNVGNQYVFGVIYEDFFVIKVNKYWLKWCKCIFFKLKG